MRSSQDINKASRSKFPSFFFIPDKPSQWFSLLILGQSREGPLSIVHADPWRRIRYERYHQEGTPKWGLLRWSLGGFIEVGSSLPPPPFGLLRIGIRAPESVKLAFNYAHTHEKWTLIVLHWPASRWMDTTLLSIFVVNLSYNSPTMARGLGIESGWIWSILAGFCRRIRKLI